MTSWRGGVKSSGRGRCGREGGTGHPALPRPRSGHAWGSGGGGAAGGDPSRAGGQGTRRPPAACDTPPGLPRGPRGRCVGLGTRTHGLMAPPRHTEPPRPLPPRGSGVPVWVCVCPRPVWYRVTPPGRAGPSEGPLPALGSGERGGPRGAPGVSGAPGSGQAPPARVSIPRRCGGDRPPVRRSGPPAEPLRAP